jgi:nicotinate-nucleotide pyrophosphorylase (carboxylating)
MSRPPADLNALPLASLYDALHCEQRLGHLLDQAVDEDMGGDLRDGDITSLASIGDENRRVEAALAVREKCVMAGAHAIPAVVHRLAPNVEHLVLASDGATIEAPHTIATLTGPLTQILRTERILLNIVTRLCSVATETSRYVALARFASPKVEIYDTRKTLPGWRSLDKYAVRCGGGKNHRIGLYDAVLLKDNHLAGVPIDAIATFVRQTAQRARAARPLRFVQVEVDTFEQLEQVLLIEEGVVDIVLVDNMTDAELADAARLRDERAPWIELEASGGVTLDNVAEIASTGVDRISVGAITHSVPSVDLGLDIAHARVPG